MRPTLETTVLDYYLLPIQVLCFCPSFTLLCLLEMTCKVKTKIVQSRFLLCSAHILRICTIPLFCFAPSFHRWQVVLLFTTSVWFFVLRATATDRKRLRVLPYRRFLIGYGQPTFCIFNLSHGLLVWLLFYLLSCQFATLASFCFCREHHILFYSAVDCTFCFYLLCLIKTFQTLLNLWCLLFRIGVLLLVIQTAVRDRSHDFFTSPYTR